jgi:hypothetical protein
MSNRLAAPFIAVPRTEILMTETVEQLQRCADLAAFTDPYLRLWHAAPPGARQTPCECRRLVPLHTPAQWGVIASDQLAAHRMGQCECGRIYFSGPLKETPGNPRRVCTPATSPLVARRHGTS